MLLRFSLVVYAPLGCNYHRRLFCGGGQGGGSPGEEGAGGVREAGGERAKSGIPKLAGTRGREAGVKGTGGESFRPPCLPPLFFVNEKLFCHKVVM